MEYLLLFAFSAFFSIQGIFKKYYEKLSDGSAAAGLLCAVYSSAAMLVCLFPANGFRMEFSRSGILYSLVYSVFNVSCTALSLYALRHGKLVVETTYSLIGGFVLPFLWGAAVYGELVTFPKLLGTVLIIFGIVCPMVSELRADRAARGKSSSSVRFHFVCMLLFLSNGAVSVATTASQKAADPIGSDAFLLLCLLESTLIALLVLFIYGLYRQKNGEKSGVRNVFWEISAKPPMKLKIYLMMILFCTLLSVSNGIGNLLSLTCAQTMDATVQFPLSSAVMILMNAAIGFFFFKEKPNRNDTVRLIFSAAGTICFLF